MSEEERDLLAEANHRIANSLALLVSLVRMQAKSVGSAKTPISNAEAQLMLESVAARITMIAQLQRLFAQAPMEGALEIGGHLREISATLVRALSSRDQPVRVHHDGSGACMAYTGHIEPLVLNLLRDIHQRDEIRPSDGRAARTHHRLPRPGR